MTLQAIEFLQHWVFQELPKVANHQATPEIVERLVRQCCREASLAGITVDEMQEEVGSLNELISVRIEDAPSNDDTDNRLSA